MLKGEKCVQNFEKISIEFRRQFMCDIKKNDIIFRENMVINWKKKIILPLKASIYK